MSDDVERKANLKKYKAEFSELLRGKCITKIKFDREGRITIIELGELVIDSTGDYGNDYAYDGSPLESYWFRVSVRKEGELYYYLDFNEEYDSENGGE